MVPKREKAWTYRVEGIPFRTTPKQLIEEYFDLDDQPHLTVRSLFPNVDCPEGEEEDHDGGLTATVYFKPQDSRPDGPRLQDNLIQVDRNFIGFTPLYVPPIGTPIVADIIAVTGLAGHAYGSWAHHDDRMWLRDYLKRTASNARILTYGYESGLKDSHSFGILQDHTNTFFRKLIDIREEGKCESRPIIFIGHSLGCLIIKKAMIDAGSIGINASRFPVRAIVFLAAPHKGLHVEALQTLVKGKPIYGIVHELEKGSATLLELNLKFAQMAHEIDILTCYETKQTKQAVKLEDGSWARKGSPVTMVDRDSAIVFTAKEIVVGADADHSEIAKIKQSQAGIFSHVKSAIHRALRPTVSLAEDHQGTSSWALPHDKVYTVPPPMYSPGSAGPYTKGIPHEPEVTSQRSPADSNPSLLHETPPESIRRSSSNYVSVAETMKSSQDAAIHSQIQPPKPVSDAIQELETQPGLDMYGRRQEPVSEPESEPTKVLDTVGSAEGATACPIARSSSTNCVLCSLPIQDSDPHYLYHEGDTSQSTGEKIKDRRPASEDLDHSPTCYNDEVPTWCCHGCAASLQAPFICPEHHLTMGTKIILTGSGFKSYVRFVSGRVTEMDNKVVIAIKENNTDALQQALGHDKRRLLGPYNSTGATPLHLAVSLGRLSCAKMLLVMGAESNVCDSRGFTPLEVAAAYEHMDIAIALWGENPEFSSPLLLSAAKYGDGESVELLLGKDGVEVGAKNEKYGNTPLHLASAKGYEKVVQMLLDHHAPVHAVNTNRDTPLHLAAAKGRVDVCSSLIGHRAELAAKNLNGMTPLISATIEKRVDVINLLFDSDPTMNVDAADNDGYTSLHWAATQGSMDICTTLLNHNASTNVKAGRKYDFRTPLLVAIVANHTDVVRLLLGRGAYGSIQHDSIRRWKDFPLFVAASRGHVSCLETLFKYCKIDFEFDGLNAIAYAAHFGEVAAVKFLLKKGASPFPPKGLKGKWKNLTFNSEGEANMSKVLEILRKAKRK